MLLFCASLLPVADGHALIVFLQENQQLGAMIASDPHAAVLCKLLHVADAHAMCFCRRTSSWQP
jgi:hypothetical protein